MRWNSMATVFALLLIGACGPGEPGVGASDGATDGMSSIGQGESFESFEFYGGSQRTCAVLDHSGLRCWGSYRYFSDPYEDYGDNEIPAVAALHEFEASVIAVGVGQGRTCVILDDERLACWGRLIEQTVSFEDAEVVHAPGIVDVAVGGNHECFLYEGGGVKCRGWGSDGALGYGSVENLGDDPDETLAELPFVDVGDPAIAIDSFDEAVCVVTDSGGVRCWGSGMPGLLGTGLEEATESGSTIGDDESPSSYDPIALPGGPVEQVAVGGYGACALHESGDVSCWGYAWAMLGYGDAMDDVGGGYGDDEDPNSLGFVPIGGKVVEIVATSAKYCVLLDDGGVKCWGSPAGYPNGYPDVSTIGDSITAADMPPLELGGFAVDIVSGWQHTCAWLDIGELRCWGSGYRGALGYGDTEDVGDDETPAEAGAVQFVR